MHNAFARRLIVAACCAIPLLTPAQQPYKVVDRWAIGGSGGWDYLLADAPQHRLYLSHNTRVEVVDTRTGKPVGALTGFKGTHGIALDNDGAFGYISDGGGNAVTVFDRRTLAVVAKIDAGTNPDGIAYEPSTRTVWAFNGRSQNVTVIDTVTRTVAATIALPGKPEFPQVDGKGNVFVNIEDKNSLVRLSAAGRKLLNTWPLHGCESPSGLAYDASGERLFSVCDNKMMAVTDAKTGAPLSLVPIGSGPDAAGFDGKNGLAFSSNADSTLTIVDTRHKYAVLQTLTTVPGARTMTYDSAEDRIYLSSASYGPAPAATAAAPRPRPQVLPNTFTILVVGRK